MTVRTTHSRLYEHNYALGRCGEERVARIYEERGYTILARNISSRFGELDIIAEREGTTVFIEVKTRTTPRWGGAEAVTKQKLRSMRRCANAWLAGRNYTAVRFDVVEIVGASLIIIEGVDDGAQ